MLTPISFHKLWVSDPTWNHPHRDVVSGTSSPRLVICYRWITGNSTHSKRCICVDMLDTLGGPYELCNYMLINLCEVNFLIQRYVRCLDKVQRDMTTNGSVKILGEILLKLGTRSILKKMARWKYSVRFCLNSVLGQFCTNNSVSFFFSPSHWDRGFWGSRCL